jgi:hypothetical protein
MKILVDQYELMKAFDIISDCRNNLPGNGWVKEQLQIACNIIGPMWANGVDENKILVNKEIIEEAFHKVSWMANQKFPYKPGDGSDFDDVYRILQKILLDNHDPTKGKCLVCGRETNKTMSALDLNYCGPCWNSGKAAEYIEKEREKPLTLITPEELMEIVRIGQEIYGKKNTEEKESVCLVTKDKHGRVTVTGSGVDTKAVWGECPQKHDDSQIPTRSKEQNIQAIKDALAKDPGKIMKSPIPVLDYYDFIELKRRLDYCEDAIGNDIEDKWARCHNAILEILDMLSEHRSYNNELSYTIGCKAEELKTKLVGEK